MKGIKLINAKLGDEIILRRDESSYTKDLYIGINYFDSNLKGINLISEHNYKCCKGKNPNLNKLEEGVYILSEEKPLFKNNIDWYLLEKIK